MNRNRTDNRKKNEKKTTTTTGNAGRAGASKTQPAKTTNTPANEAKKSQQIEPAPQPTPVNPAPPPPPPEEKQPDPEELKRIRAATVIQCAWRKRQAKSQLERARKEKADFDEKMKELENQVFLQQVKLEQELEEKKRLKKLKEKQQKQKREQRRKQFLSAAFEGNLQEMKFLLNDLGEELNALQRELGADKVDKAVRNKETAALIDCKDPNGNSALSEAAVGGAADVVKFLISSGADPNSKGAFGRTPLWRAAFSSNVECVQILLENGADPRIYSTDGQRAVDAATKENIIELLKNWNISLTERMLAQIAKSRLESQQEMVQSLDQKRRAAYLELERVRNEFGFVKNELYKCVCELKRLHSEYLMNESMYGPLIEEKERLRTDLQIKYEDLRERCVKANIGYRELMAELDKEKKQIKSENAAAAGDGDSDDEEGGGGDQSAVMSINIRELDDMILRDLGDKVKNSVDKWPLVIDQGDQAATYLRYRDTNYVNCLDPESMKPNRFRLALIGAIRYGKPFVLDLMLYEQELIEAVKAVCDQIAPRLYVQLCSKEIVKPENYMKLVHLESDGKEYEEQNFSQIRIKNFKVLFLTSNPYPCDELMNMVLPFKIVATNSANDF